MAMEPSMPGQEASSAPSFSVLRSIKLGSFHVGSSMTDLLTSGVWNRIMISDLGVPAWPVAALAALRYLLAPLTIWIGHRSDTRPLLGSHRLSYIWLGRLLMLLSLPLLPLSTGLVSRDRSSVLGWALAAVSLLLFGAGTLISGAPFLALLHDSAPYERRGQVVSIVQFELVASFAFLPLIYASLLPAYDSGKFWSLVLVAVMGAACFWIFPLLGEERRRPTIAHAPEQISLREAVTGILKERAARRYAWFLGASAFFAFMQDAMLEPFGGDVFGLAAGATTRFNAYWGSGVLAGMLGTILITRRAPPDRQVSTTSTGLAIMAVCFASIGVISFLHLQALLVPALILFGLGFGIFGIGGISLLMAMSREERAASYMALWTVVQLIARGGGIACGGVLRDLVLAVGGDHSVAYGTVFVVEALGALLSIGLLLRVGVAGFAASRSADVSKGQLTPMGE